MRENISFHQVSISHDMKERKQVLHVQGIKIHSILPPPPCRTYSQPRGYITIKHPRDVCIREEKGGHGTHVEILSQTKWQNLFSFN
jgi:hypothetical protein